MSTTPLDTTSAVESSATTTVPAVGAADSGGSAPSPTGATSAAGEGVFADQSGSPGAPTPEFDWNTWDGTLDVAPETYRPALSRYESIFNEKLTRAKEEAALYRDVASGFKDDPDVVELRSKLEAAEKRAAELEAAGKQGTAPDTKNDARIKELEAEIEKFHSEAAEKYINDFKQRHAAIYSDPAKRAELVTLLDDGWEEEAAAMLVGTTKEVRAKAVAVATEFGLTGKGHRIAVERAIAKPAEKKAETSTAALLTAGADGTVSASRTSETNVKAMSADRARAEAARLALVHSR